MSSRVRIDVRTPEDPRDTNTTLSRVALPPIDFTAAAGATSTNFTITDHQFPQGRGPTASYRIYFLPNAFSPRSTTYFGKPVSQDSLRPSPVETSALRAAGRNVADIVATVPAPGLGAVLTASDTKFFGQSGWYYCVGVNQRNQETPVANLVRVG